VFTWLPSYLHTTRGLTVVGTSGYLAVVIAGSFLGYAGSSHLHDRIGGRPSFIIFAVSGVVCVLAYTQIPAQANALLLVLGIPLGMAAAGSLAGNGVFFSELFPSRVRGAGVGLAHNFGCGVAAFFPFIVGALSSALGLKAAISVGPSDTSWWSSAPWRSRRPEGARSRNASSLSWPSPRAAPGGGQHRRD